MKLKNVSEVVEDFSLAIEDTDTSEALLTQDRLQTYTQLKEMVEGRKESTLGYTDRELPLVQLGNSVLDEAKQKINELFNCKLKNYE